MNGAQLFKAQDDSSGLMNGPPAGIKHSHEDFGTLKFIEPARYSTLRPGFPRMRPEFPCADSTYTSCMQKKMERVTVRTTDDSIIIEQEEQGESQGVVLSPEQIPLLIEWLQDALKGFGSHQEQ
jgi:hypothetical protein